MAAQNTKPQGSAPPAAYLLVAAGGGVVGQDYARWMEVDPLVGAGIGSFVAAALTGFLYHLHKDPGGKIKETCSTIGAIAGLILGAYIANENTAPGEGLTVAIVAGIGAAIGAGVGQMVAAFISFSALALLFLSQGPVGLMVRTFILGLNDGPS